MKAGTVAVIGRANAGKSTLVNVLVGEKVAIVSPKPQTTRDRILGILNEAGAQVVFADTPGIYKAGTALSGRMLRTAESTAKDVELILFVHDGHKGVSEEDIALMKRYQSVGVPMLIAYTKTDIMPAENIPQDVKEICEGGVACDVYPVSARKGRGIEKLRRAIVAALPEGEPLFPEDIVSDKSERFMLGEIMREKILLKYDKEIPHGIAVLVTKFERGQNGIAEVALDIVCEKPNHKAILIGKQGAALKEVLSFARKDMEKFLGCKVFLTGYVKVKEGWRNNQYQMRNFGYEEL